MRGPGTPSGGAVTFLGNRASVPNTFTPAGGRGCAQRVCTGLASFFPGVLGACGARTPTQAALRAADRCANFLNQLTGGRNRRSGEHKSGGGPSTRTDRAWMGSKVPPLLAGPVAAGMLAARVADVMQQRWDRRYGPYINVVDEPTSTSAKTAMATRSRSRTMMKRRTKKRGRRMFRRRLRAPTIGFPRFQLVKFKVVTMVNPSPGAGAGPSVYNLQANSLEDPHGGAGSNLPLYLDQYAAVYSKYVVVRSTTYVKVFNATSTGSVCYGLTLRAPGESDVKTTIEAYNELPMTKSKLLTSQMDQNGLGMSYNAKRYWHVRKFMDSEDLQATFSTTPVAPDKKAYLQFWHNDTNNTSGYTLEAIITTVYTVLLFNRITPTRSAV